MSLRRKSCDACFRGKRKCDLEYPICKRCERNGKQCRYTYQPPGEASFLDKSSTGQGLATDDATNEMILDFDKAKSMHSPGLTDANECVPSSLGLLGEIQPVVGLTPTWDWVINELKAYPITFAQKVETAFMRQIFPQHYPQVIGKAFSVCAAHASLNGTNQSIFSQIIDDEVAILLRSESGTTLLEELSGFQALVLYQIIRLLNGNVKQRLAAEQQKSYVEARGLMLLQRAKIELGASQSTWRAWLLAENVRRAVMVAYLLYGVYSLNRLGVCPELPTMVKLPVSTRPDFWEGESGFLPDSEVTVNYEDFATSWAASPMRHLAPFDKVLLVPCKGIEQVEVFSSLAG